MNCFGCGAPDPSHACSGCRVARYCSAACQQGGWSATHAVACEHFGAFFGVKGHRLDTNGERFGYMIFTRALRDLDYRPRGSYITSASWLCASILTIVRQCFPDMDVREVDTSQWRAQVEDDLYDHAKDAYTPIGEYYQLWRNLPEPAADMFMNGNVSVRKAMRTSSSNTDSSRQLSEEMQVMALTLSAYSLADVMQGLTHDEQRAVLLHLLDRDVFEPLSRCSLPLSKELQLLMDNRVLFDTFRFEDMKKAHANVVDVVTDQLVRALTAPFHRVFPGETPGEVSRTIRLEGHYFGLDFTNNFMENSELSKWYVHVTASKRFFHKMPNELARAMAAFASSPAYRSSEAVKSFSDTPELRALVRVAVQIDTSVGCVLFLLNRPEYQRMSYRWPDGATGASTYAAPPDTIVASAATGYQRIAARRSDRQEHEYMRDAALAPPSSPLELAIDGDMWGRKMK